jgi:hypothetical protein
MIKITDTDSTLSFQSAGEGNRAGKAMPGILG